MTVLVIDDNSTIHFIIRAVLEIRGIRILSATDGLQGFKIAQEQHPDLILLDFILPKITGFHLCKMLKESKQTKSIPIILISSKADKIGKQFIHMLGAVNYVAKPFKTEVLIRVVEKALEIYQQPLQN